MIRHSAFWTLIAATALVGWLLFEIVRPLLIPLVLAVVLALLCRPMFHRLTDAFRGHRRLAAFAATVLVLVIGVTPLVGGLIITGQQLFRLTTDRVEPVENDGELRKLLAALAEELTPEEYSHFRNEILAGARPTETVKAPENARAANLLTELEWNYSADELRAALNSFGIKDVLSPAASPRLQALRKRVERFVPAPALDRMLASVNTGVGTLLTGIYARTQSFLSNVVAAAVGLGIMAVALYYFFADGPEIADFIDAFLPLEAADERSLMRQFEEVCRGVVIGMLASALGQGILMGIGLAIAGVPNLWLLATLTIVAGVVPVFGTVVVWLPVGIWLLFEERPGAALFILAYGGIVVSGVDNLIRAHALHGSGRLHPLVGLVSMVGGVQVLGLWGILLGPIVVGFFYSLIRILRQRSEEETRPSQPAPPALMLP